MANYHEYCANEATDPNRIAVGLGDTTSGLLSKGPVGEERICIVLDSKPIEWPEGQKPEGYGDWTSLTLECAFELASELERYRHVWDTSEVRSSVDSKRRAHLEKVMGRPDSTVGGT